MLITISFMFLIVTYSTHNKSNEWQRVSNNLDNIGVNIEKVEVEGHCFFNSNKSLVAIITQIYKDSAFAYPSKLEVKKDEVILKSSYTTLSVKRISKENLNFASFIVSQYMPVKNINNIRGSITNGFDYFTKVPTFSYLLQGKYAQRLTTKAMKDIAKKILVGCGSKNNNGIVEGHLVSYIGFAPTLSEKLEVLDKVVNLNVALRYDDVDGNTYIWIGCPIIAIDY